VADHRVALTIVVGGKGATDDEPQLRATTGSSPAGLYVHVPFCVSLCPYCDFVVYAGAAARGRENRVAAFGGALLTEIRLRADALDERFGRPGASARPPLATVYLGGGTPSLLPTEVIVQVLGLIRKRFGLEDGAEISIEANPGRDERGDPRALRAAGVTRISFGAQSFNPLELARLGRRHRVRETIDAVTGAREAGIASINLDLLYDVPGGSLEIWMDSLDMALSLSPDHLSLYALTLDDPDAEGLTGPTGDHLPVRKGARRWRDEARVDQDEDLAAAEYHHAVHRLAEDGWHGYEISNWARPGHESRHNLAYWERRPYEAVGPGAHAFDGAVRRWNAARFDAYLAALSPADGSAPRLPPGGSEVVDERAAASERVILGLRTDRGVPRSAAMEPPLGEWFGWALAAELLALADDDRVVLTTRGRLLSNELFARLI
jgi:putative oxygen-independent coproporphyrinogen III oxidase